MRFGRSSPHVVTPGAAESEEGDKGSELCPDSKIALLQTVPFLFAPSVPNRTKPRSHFTAIYVVSRIIPSVAPPYLCSVR